MAWNANWATSEGTGKLLKPALTELRLAINERADVAGQPDIGVIPTADIYDDSWSDYFDTIQGKITALIPLYVNSEDNGGDWDGEATIPNWTTATIVLETDAGSRLDAPTDPLVSASWLYQQYQLLNLLRWTQKDTASSTTRTFKSGFSGVSWLAAEAAFVVATPTTGGSSTPWLNYLGQDTGGAWTKSLNTNNKTFTAPTSTFDYDADLYSFPTKTFYDEFETGLGYTENVFNFKETKLSQNGNFNLAAPPITVADGALTIPPVTGGGRRGTVLVDFTVISKWDFTYID